MARVNLLLLAILTVCALALVTAQHEARKRFADLEREQARERALEVEFGQLQLEASTWAGHVRVERLARERLRMRAPDPRRLLVVELPAAAGAQ